METHPVGGTAIPGLYYRPKIDMLVVIGGPAGVTEWRDRRSLSFGDTIASQHGLAYPVTLRAWQYPGPERRLRRAK